MKTTIKFLLVISLFVLSFKVNAQPWMKSLKTEHPTFFEIQKSFYDYYKTNNEDKKESTEEKDGSYEKFKRWEWFWEQRVDKNGNFPVSDILWKEFKKYNEIHSNQKALLKSGSANWTYMGPFTSAGGYIGIGRVNCIAFHPTDLMTMWVGSPAGGLWKTTDQGVHWTTNTDYFPVLGISDIAIDNSNPDIMYVATGDGDNSMGLANGFGDTKSIGVLKSLDGGNTWSYTGLNWNVTSQKLIRRLLIDPYNSQILLAATSDGIWRTTDGGATWANQQTGWFIDMVFNTTDHNYVYATTFDNGGNAQIFTSTDLGKTWTQVTNFSGYNRIKLAVTADWDVLIEALCSNSSDNGLGGLWYSQDNGATFKQYFTSNCSNNLLNSAFDGSACGGQGFYDLSYIINPLNYKETWLGGVNTWRTTDGGSNWYLNNIWASGLSTSTPVVHADKHFFSYHPLNSSLFYECNDGGLYATNNGGSNWYDLSNGLGISEIYRIGTSATIANDVICGLQDNGTKELYNGNWNDKKGGDGFECIIDYTDAKTEYASYVQGEIYRTFDSWSSSTTISNNIPGFTNYVNNYGHGPGAWVTPYVIDPLNHNTLYAGYHNVWKTTDQGNSWSAISNFGLASNPKVIDHPLHSLAVAPSNSQFIYTATYDTLFFTHNGGTNWYCVPLGINTANISYITVDPSNAQVVYMTLSGYNDGNKVYKSADGGTTWNNYSGTLPNVPVNCIVYEKGTNEGLYVGTDLGVYYSDGSMSDWIAYNDGLPNVIVNELEISYINKKLWAATFGRGLWNSDLYSSMVGIENVNVINDFNIYPNPANSLFVVSYSLLGNSKTSMEMLDITGQVVKTQLIAGKLTNVDISDLAKGVYIVKVSNENGVAVKRVVKE